MKSKANKRLRRKLFIGVVLLALIGGAVALWLHRIEERRLAAVAKIYPPPAYAFYRAISESDAAPPAEVLSALAQLNLNANPFDSLEVFDELLQQHEKNLSQDPEWSRLSSLTEAYEFSFVAWSKEDNEALGFLLAEHSGFITKIREAAARGGPVRRLNVGTGEQLKIPQLTPFRDFARLLRADAVYNSSKGNYTEVEADLLAMAQLGETLASEPMFISQMFRILMTDILFSTVEDVMELGDLPPASLRSLVEELDGMYHREAFAHSFQGEATFVLDIYRAVREGETSLDEITVSTHTDVSSVSGSWGGALESMANMVVSVFEGFSSSLKGSVFGIPAFRIDETRYAETMHSLIAANALPYYRAEPLIQAIEQNIELTFSRDSTSRSIIAGFVRMGDNQARHEAKLDLIRIACALELYRNEHNVYPEILESIADTLGGEIPVDPFVGTAYQHSLTDDGFFLYSVGDNLVDDQGTHDVRKGDLVWRGE